MPHDRPCVVISGNSQQFLGAQIATARWLARQEKQVASLPVGLFGASTGAAAALVAAAQTPRSFRAIVSRGGRPRLAKDRFVHHLSTQSVESREAAQALRRD